MKFRKVLHPHDVGVLVNNLHRAEVWPGPVPRKHQAADPTDSYLLDSIEAAQPDYAITGDKRAGILALGTLGAHQDSEGQRFFCTEVLHI